jgi:rhomboid protease GluP
MKSAAPVTKTLLILIACVFVIELVFGGPSLRGGMNLFVADINPALLQTLGAIVPGMFVRHEYWRLVAAMFLHANVLHWLFNSWALYQLGSLYESMFGSRRFALTYFVTGICASIASAIHAGTTNGSSVGASGAIFGILGAFIFSIRRSPQWRHEPWTRRLTSELVFWALINLAFGLSVQFIDNTAHITGLVSGLLLGLIVPHRVPPPPPSSGVIDVSPRPPQNYT